jgi:hypothetical protein
VNAWVSGGLVPAAVRGSKMSHFMHISDWCESILCLHAVLPIVHYKAQSNSHSSARLLVRNIVVFWI